MSFPLDRMRCKMWRMAQDEENYQIYMCGSVFMVVEPKYLWKQWMFCFKTGKLLKSRG